MHKFLSLSFALVFCIEAFMPVVDKCEVETIGNIYDDYQESWKKSRTSITDFLVLHYGADEKKNHHNDEHDEELPFHEKACCQPTLVVPEQLNFSCNLLSPVAPKKYSVYKTPVGSELPDSIFQPPKHA